MTIPLRAARERADLTQAELAELAGVSRQLIGAVEAGRHAPAVDAAIRIAQALGAGVEELFAPPAAPERPVSVLGDPLRAGDAVVMGRVGDRLVAAPLRSLASGDMSWATPDGVNEEPGLRRFPGVPSSGLVVVGCDPILGICETLLNRGAARRLVAVAGSSGAALASLARGTAHAALVHGPEGRLPAPPAGTHRVRVASWRVGVAGAPAGDPSLDAVLERDGLVQREESAASQQALMRHLRASGRPMPRVLAQASGHLDAARRAAIAGCAAVTFEPAALEHGLRFVPLETHVVELWIDGRWASTPAADALGGLLTSDAFRARARLIGGYDLTGCGDLTSATAPGDPAHVLP